MSSAGPKWVDLDAMTNAELASGLVELRQQLDRLRAKLDEMTTRRMALNPQGSGQHGSTSG